MKCATSRQINVSQEDSKCTRNLSILVLYHLGFNQKIHLGLIALINFHLGCSTPSHVLGRCPLFNLGLHQNVIVGFVLWAYYTSPIGFRFRPDGRAWSRFIVDCGRLKGTSFTYSAHKVLLACQVSRNIHEGRQE